MKEVLFKTNDLILANTQLKSNEFKFFNKILFNCQKTKDDCLRVAIISYEEILEIFKMNKFKGVSEIEKLLTRFREISIKFKYKDRIIGTGLIAQWERNEKDNNFKCFLNSELYGVLMSYKELGYSPIDVKMVRQAKGYYTQRLYEILRIWSGSKKDITYSVDELKDFFNINRGNSYDRYINFKNKVIKPAIKEINEKLNMDVSFTENKVSRSIVSLTFCIVDNEPRHYNFKNIGNDGNKILKEQVGIEDTAKEVVTTNDPVVDIEEIVSSATMKAIEELQINKIKISAKTLERNLNTYGEDIFNRAINILIGKKEEGEKITAPVKFLNGILENLKTKDEIAATKAENENTKTLNFTNYSQREYDYDSLEKQLLGWDK